MSATHVARRLLMSGGVHLTSEYWELPCIVCGYLGGDFSQT